MTNECSGTQGKNEATKEAVSDDTYDVLGSETLLKQAKMWVRSMLLCVFAGNGLDCDNIDECTTNCHDCNVNEICTNSLASFSCTCYVGYIGNVIRLVNAH